MNVRLRTLVLVGTCLLAPGLAYASGTIEGFYGIGWPPGTSFSAATSSATSPHLFNDTQQVGGGDLMFNLTWFQFGAIADHMWAKDKASLTAVGGLVGLKLAAGSMRIDLMGELGGHLYGNLSNVNGSSKDQWLGYVGLRPGIAFKLSEPDQPGLLIGVWGYGRWDLNTKSGPVTAANVGEASPGNLKLGGATYGLTARLGFDF